jgi:hypothetical protein
MIPKGYVRADTDGLLYKREDTYWVFPPSADDAGWVGPKPGAVPFDETEGDLPIYSDEDWD